MAEVLLKCGYEERTITGKSQDEALEHAKETAEQEFPGKSVKVLDNKGETLWRREGFR